MNELKHYGTKRHSGRYPWGSGEEPYQHEGSFLKYIGDMKKEGMTDTEIARALNMKTVELRARRTWAIAEERAARVERAQRLKAEGHSNVGIGKKMGINESSVRSLLDPSIKKTSDEIFEIKEIIKNAVNKGQLIDVGKGVENHLGISNAKLKAAVVLLQDEGYKVHFLDTLQVGTGHKTSLKVISKPGVEWTEVNENKDKIRLIQDYTEGDGRAKRPPVSIDGERIYIRYAEEGGEDKDGIIELRRGVDDISLGQARYAQVRIGVDGKLYLKGVAVYSDDMPDGVDIIFNTPKKQGTPREQVFKPINQDDPINPFGATTVPKDYTDSKGKVKQGALNIIYEEGEWSDWSNTLSSQMLSKQKVPLAKRQLELAAAFKREEYDEIMSLTNSAVRKRLLEGFADDADSAAVHLKAAALPRQSTHVLLPFTDIKENEIYAPQYRNGESVVLIRHPHGGIFEIPELIVNNKGSKLANKTVKNARDAVGINPKVAARLSGADFDGDTVIVIPNKSGAVRTAPALDGLKDFDPHTRYAAPKGMPKVGPKTGFNMPIQMGGISNLITDMTIKGAHPNEIARAVRHSMVVIDAEKHNLNYKLSAEQNAISQLKKKYQGGATAGAATLISKASAEKRVPARDKYYKIDKETGKKIYTPTGESYIDKDGKQRYPTTKTTRMAEADDAHKLSSGTQMETVYADYANKMKALANEARKSYINTPPIKSTPEARRVYAKEIATLTAKLNVALKNAPLERHAQAKANMVIDAKKRANPNMDKKEEKRMKAQSLEEARIATGAKKIPVSFTDKEWEAVQAGAITDNKLKMLLDNSDLDAVKKLATPRLIVGMTPAKEARARAMINSGYTQAEVASALGVSTTTIARALD